MLFLENFSMISYCDQLWEGRGRGLKREDLIGTLDVQIRYNVSSPFGTAILNKTVEKIVYLDSIFLNIVAVPVLPSPPSPESNVVVYSKESLIPGRLWEATLNWGKGFSFRKGVVLEIVLLRRKVEMMGKTFSSSFVRDCSLKHQWQISQKSLK